MHFWQFPDPAPQQGQASLSFGLLSMKSRTLIFSQTFRIFITSAPDTIEGKTSVGQLSKSHPETASLTKPIFSFIQALTLDTIRSLNSLLTLPTVRFLQEPLSLQHKLLLIGFNSFLIYKYGKQRQPTNQ